MASKTWILTGSPENFAATRDHGFRVIGMKEGRRNMAQQMEPGDLIVFYLTRVKAFGGAVRITGEMYEDRSKIWPGKPGKPDPYPWRFETEPEVVLDEDRLGAGRGRGALARTRAEVAGGALDARLPGTAADGLRRGP